MGTQSSNPDSVRSLASNQILSTKQTLQSRLGGSMQPGSALWPKQETAILNFQPAAAAKGKANTALCA